ncbi:ABC transporter substrate-binding protein [Nocardioides sp. SR21]|uniref:ABC transporter substrate-binding protein n=1 Tax=Nocardioides sp. SR21 TaxID=2919501 RepID=UPI001FA95A55|nr:ABC transporter substrate-binding protein [Nocardioides sp. SR21]
MRTPSPVSRRIFLGGSVVATLLVAGCGEDDSTASSADPTASTGPWVFTDDRGQRIELASRPTRIVAFSTPTAALSEMGVTPQGVFAWSPLADDTQLRYTDLSEIQTVGEVWGELDLEVLAGLAPDVVITGYDPTDGSLYGLTEELIPKVEAIAPILAVDSTLPLLEQYDRFQELGTALGADLSQAEVLDAREEFNELSQQLAAAAAAKPGLRVMAVSAAEDGMNVAQPEPNSDLSYYESLGLTFVVPDGKGIFWWEELSGENINKYDADVILVDIRAGETDRKALEKHPLWATLPAVEAGQVFGWHAYDPPTYRFYSEALADLVAAVEGSEVVA